MFATQALHWSTRLNLTHEPNDLGFRVFPLLTCVILQNYGSFASIAGMLCGEPVNSMLVDGSLAAIPPSAQRRNRRCALAKVKSLQRIPLKALNELV